MSDLIPNILQLETFIDGKRITVLTAIAANGQMVGIIELIFAKRKIAAMRRLFVHPNFRMVGVGRDLVNKCCAIAKNNQCEGISLLVDLKNVDAYIFYIRLGFICAYQDDDDWIFTKQLQGGGSLTAVDSLLSDIYTWLDEPMDKRLGARVYFHETIGKLLGKPPVTYGE